MTKHSSVVGGSTARRVLNCNYSIDLNRNLPPEPWNIYAATGSALHAEMELALRSTMVVPGGGYYCKKHKVEVTPELIAKKVTPALAWYDEHFGPYATCWIEESLDFGNRIKCPTTHATAFGTADVVYVADDDLPRGGLLKPGEAGVIDWKFGDGHLVPAEDNDQMRFYLAAALHRGLLPEREVYVAHIFQPSEKLAPEQYASRGTYTIEDLLDFTERLAQAVSGPRKAAVGDWCKNCRGRLRCEALKKSLSGVMETGVDGLDNIKIGKLLDQKEAIAAFFEDVERAATDAIRKGIKIPGWDIVAGLGRREWINEDAANAALARIGLDAKERRTTKIISPTQAEKLLTKRQIDSKATDKLFAKHVTRPTTAERLVKVSKEGDVYERAAKAIENHLLRK